MQIGRMQIGRESAILSCVSSMMSSEGNHALFRLMLFLRSYE